jgi:hypothetical protein
VSKEFVNESCARDISLTRSIHIVLMSGFIKGDVFVTWMSVEFGEFLPGVMGHCSVSNLIIIDRLESIFIKIGK